MLGALAARPLTQLLSLRQFLPALCGALGGRGYAVVSTVGLVGRTGGIGGGESESEEEQGLGYDPKFRSPTEMVWPATKHQQRFASKLHHALETALLHNDGLRDTLVCHLGFAVQEVRMSPDNLKAYIQWDSVKGHAGELQRELRQLSPRLRSAVATALRARNVPQLVFVRDRLTPHQQQVEDVFAMLDAEEAAADAAAAGGTSAARGGGGQTSAPGASRDAGFASAVEVSDEDSEEELEEEADEEAGVAELERQRQEARQRPTVG